MGEAECSDAPFTLAELLEPVDEATFFAQHWGRQPLHVSGSPERFERVLTLAELDGLLELFGRPHPQALRLADQKSGVHHALPGDQPAHIDRLLSAFLGGQTLNVNDLAERHAGVRALTMGLFASFRCRVTANAFLTPPDGRAFAPHFDTHEVLVLQLAGRKRWRVSPPVVEAPLKQTTQEREVARERCGELLVDALLSPGDLLYVPRGFVHEVFTEGEPSLHITVGVHAPSVSELLRALLDERTGACASLRQTPSPALRADPQALAALLREGLSELVEGDVAALLEQHSAQVLLAEQCLPGARFARLAELAAPELGARFAKRSGAICQLQVDAMGAAVIFQGNAVRGPRKLAEPLRFIAELQGSFSPRELPGPLSDAERLTLTRRLLREGLIQPD